jgi:YhcH/YjgK/YiaL family protein
MVLDSLANASKYEALHPAFKQAFDFVKNTDFSKLEPGKIELNGKDLFVNFAEVTGKDADTAKMETHKNYIDIQIAIFQDEQMGYTPTLNLTQPRDAYNDVKDVTFYFDKAETMLQVKKGEFAIFFPEDGHQPGIGEGTWRKVIVKVKL